jgi:hypothetical protein
MGGIGSGYAEVDASHAFDFLSCSARGVCMLALTSPSLYRLDFCVASRPSCPAPQIHTILAFVTPQPF